MLITNKSPCVSDRLNNRDNQGQRPSNTRGGGVLPYISYIGMCRAIVGFLRRFGLQTGIHFAHFGLESGMVFEGTTGAYESIYRFNFK